MSVHKITVRNKEGEEGKLTTGANTRVLLDGKPLKGARFFKFEVGAGKLSKVLIEMYAEVEIEVEADLKESTLKEKRKVFDTNSVRVLSSLTREESK